MEHPVVPAALQQPFSFLCLTGLRRLTRSSPY
jgi:hypothetical protein